MSLTPGELFGREMALGRLRDALAAADEGRGQIALVSGEAGIGKSALVEALAREAEARGAAVTRGRAWEFADAPPYFPLWPCLRALGMDALTGADSARDDEERFRLWEDVAGALRRASSQTTSVWILEDLHAADLGSLDLLSFLAQTLRALRVLIVATTRSRDPRLGERALQRLTRLARDGVDIRLEVLADLDVVALVERTLGRAAPASAVRRIVELTGGNPLFVTECARALRAGGAAPGAPGWLSTTLEQTIMERVGLLPAAARDALAAGAIVGREFSAALIARMADALPARAIDQLLPALRAGFISEVGPGAFVFSHALVRDAIEQALEPSVRARLHERAEAALAPLGDDADVLVERTRHALSALPFRSAEGALDLARRASELLEREGAFDRAFELEARLAELERTGLVPPRSPLAKLRAAELARAAGRSEARRALCEDVLRAARAAGDAALLARAALLHGADVRPNVVERTQVALYEEAERALGSSEPLLLCRVLARLATALQPTLDQTRPQALARSAIEQARAAGDAAALLDVLELAFWGLYAAPLAERQALASELSVCARAAGDGPRLLVAHGWLAAFALESGDFVAFDRHVADLLARSEELGHPRHRWRALLFASTRATLDGHFAESDRAVTEVQSLMSLVDDPALPHALATHDLFRKRNQRRDAELPAALAAFERTLEGVWEARTLASSLRAACAARTGDPAVAGAALAEVGAVGARLENDPMLGPLLAEAVALAGDDARRRRLRDALSERAGAEVISLMPYTYEGTVGRLLGLLDASLGEPVAAEARLGEAYELFTGRGQRPFAAQTAYELARLLEANGRPAEARPWLARASALAQEVGMPGLTASLGADPAPGGAEAGPTLGLERAGDVWTLTWGAERASVKDSRGVELLARLVARPDEEIHVLALASDQGVGLNESDAGEQLDEQAERAYREQVKRLEQEAVAAERGGDGTRAAKLAREREALQAELRRALGLGGRRRRAGSATERARISVQKRIKEAIARVGEVSPSLGRFLDKSVSTGTFCCFRPLH